MTVPRLGLQLYTVRHATAPLSPLLAVVAAAGYEGVESVATPGVEPLTLRDALADAGLTLTSAHVPLASLRDDLPRVATEHHVLGTPLLVVPFLAPSDRPHDLSGWAALGRELSGIGDRLADEGLALAYHHHDFELVRHGARDGLTALLEAADAERLGLELDTGWLAATGEDPVAWIQRWGPRIARVHLKDFQPDSPTRWADVGQGTVDVTAVVAASHAAGVAWLLVEHDDPADPLATARRSAAAALAILERT